MSSGDGVSRAGDAHARGVMLRQYGCGRKGEEMNEHRQDGVDRQGTGLSPAIAGSGRSGLGGVADPASPLASLAGLAVSGVVLLLIGTLGFLSVGHLKNQARQIVQDTLPGLSYAGEANARLTEGFNRTLQLLLAYNPEKHARVEKEVESLTQATTLCLDGYKNQIYTREDQALFDKMLQRRAEYLAIRERTIGLIGSNRAQEAKALAKAELMSAYEWYKQSGEKLFDYNVRQGNSRGQNIMTICSVAQFGIAALGILLFLLGFWIGLFK